MDLYSLVFIIVGLVSVVSMLLVATLRHPVYCALSLLTTFVGMGVLFALLKAPFVAAIQILVYGGAIMVLFLFVIMLLNLRPEEMGEELDGGSKMVLGIICLLLFFMIAVPIYRANPDRLLPEGATLSNYEHVVPAATEGEANIVQKRTAHEWGSAASLGRMLFSEWLLVFELISILIMIAVIGGVIYSRRIGPGGDHA